MANGFKKKIKSTRGRKTNERQSLQEEVDGSVERDQNVKRLMRCQQIQQLRQTAAHSLDEPDPDTTYTTNQK